MNQSVGWREHAERIAADRGSGASALAQSCAGALIAFTEQEQFASMGTLKAGFLELATVILRRQPSMAPLVNLLNQASLALEQVDTPEEARAQLCRVSRAFAGFVDGALSQVAESALSVFPSSGTILTLSYSSAVTKSLLLAKQRGRAFKVICLESRPNLEGRSLAAYLAEQGFDVQLTVDAAVFDSMRDADLFLVGADSLTEGGVVNKLGTATLATVAQVIGKPGYVACDTSKLWPAALGLPPVAVHPAEEVWPDAPAKVLLRNVYFDLAGYEGFQGVITEKGVLSTSEISKMCREQVLSDDIRRIVVSSRIDFV